MLQLKKAGKFLIIFLCSFALCNFAYADYVKKSGGGSTGAPTDATYITQTPDTTLTAEQALSALSTGIMRVATTTGVITSLTDSAGIASNVSDETGTGVMAFATAPTFTTNITTPLVIGGTTTTSDLNLQTTSGIGATGADMHFLVGNNGATEAMTILNDGKLGIGIAAPTAEYHLKKTFSSGTNTLFYANAVITGVNNFDAFKVETTGSWSGIQTIFKLVDDGSVRMNMNIGSNWLGLGTAQPGIGFQAGSTDVAVLTILDGTTPGSLGILELAGNSTFDGSPVGGVEFLLNDNTTNKKVSGITGYAYGGTATARGGYVLLEARLNTTTDLSMMEAMRVYVFAENVGAVSIGTAAAPTSQLNLGGNFSASAWTTSGIGLRYNAATYTDTSTAAAGTVAVRTAHSFGAPTFASTNAITVTDAFTLYVPKPIAGTNTTITRANSAYFEGNVGIGTTSPTHNLTIANGATSAGFLAINEDTDNGANNATFTVSALAADTDYTLPPDDGDAGEQLQTDGAGVLTWEAAGSGSGAPTTADYLVGTANASLSAEIVVGTTELSLVNIGSTLVGGSATTADLNLKTTSGIGAAGADMHFLVGNNGATEAMTILNSGYVGIGVSPSLNLDIGGSSGDLLVRIKNTSVVAADSNEILLDRGANTQQNTVSFITATTLNWAIGTMYNAGSANAVFSIGNGLNLTDSKFAINGSDIGIGTTSPDRLFHVETSTALTNTVSYAERLSHITSGTPANSIGVGLEFEQETSANNNEVIATIEAVVTDVTALSEDADLVVKTMTAGAAATEVVRFTSIGTVRLASLAADPASGLADGDLWYRSDVDEFRCRLNGVTYKLTVSPI